MKTHLYIFCKKFTNYSLECSSLEEALNLALYDIHNSEGFPVFILEDNKVVLNQMDIAKLYKGGKNEKICI